MSLFFHNKDKGSRIFLSALISLRIVWAIYAYWSIWYEFNHPDEWDMNTPDSALIAYATLFPILILALDWLVMRFVGLLIAIYNSKKKDDASMSHNATSISPTPHLSRTASP